MVNILAMADSLAVVNIIAVADSLAIEVLAIIRLALAKKVPFKVPFAIETLHPAEI